jgi:alpha-tubulin suppressor-like RCC1 family protein
LALRTDAKLLTWGNSATSIPAAATNIVAIACGGFHSLALRADGKLFAWGDNSYGELNIPPGLSNIVSIAGTTSGTLVLTADDGPPLLGQTLLNPAVLGSNARLRVTAISTTPLSYQWFFNGDALAGATNSSLVLTNIQFDQAGSYSVVVSNIFGSATNSDLNLVIAPVGLTMQPQNQTNLAGGSASFSVAAIGPGPLAYQWQLNGADLPGATTTSLALTNLQMSDAGLYSVVVTNTFGAVVSSNALLTIVPLVITAAPQSQSSFPGGTVSMGISVQCNLPVAYQWQFNGVTLEWAVLSSLTLTNLQYSQAGVYTVTVSTSVTNVNSSASLNITPIAAIGGNWNWMGAVPWALTNVVAVANGNAHTVALLSDGTVQGWGTSIGLIPAGLTNAVAVSAGSEHSLVLNADGTVVGWGGLTPLPGLSNIVAVACGFYHSLALRSDGTVVAWGGNTYGQTNFPADLTNVVSIKAGKYHSLALTADGRVVAWGAGTTNTGTEPALGQSIIPAWLDNVTAIAAGSEFSMALRGDGSVVVWGWNNAGETNVPPGLSHVVALSAGWQNALALRADGTAVAWGDNSNGETNLPAGLTNVIAISGSDGPYASALVGQTPPVMEAAILNPTFGNNGLSFSFASQSGRVYSVEYKASLAESSWTPLPLIAGTGHLVTAIDPTVTGSQRFYRIRRW